ncbi:unnamed protein product [Sphenostylis stenocarpa]|uniref:Uncharacterized protein n=1 Tax=Sphenostylis stenocarpa TaxID=92480 RepID=A0AA86VMH3_9FABA|nr:unnamed protein product [Sphenostylis stenocarpa]
MKQETIVLYPVLGRGHIVSMVELAMMLLQSTHNYSIIILLTNGFLDHHTINAYIHRISSSHPSISFLRLPHTPLPTFATTVSFTAKVTNFMKSNTHNVATTLSQISKATTVKALIIDFFCSSAMEPASSMGIPVYYFFTSGAAVLALFSYFPKLHQERSVSFKDMVGVELSVPGNASLKAVKLPEPMLERDDPAYWDVLDFCTRLAKARGILVNSFSELEPAAVQAVAHGACFPNVKLAPSVYCIGPLIAEPQESGTYDKLSCVFYY